jgi:hypothetical protein
MIISHKLGGKLENIIIFSYFTLFLANKECIGCCFAVILRGATVPEKRLAKQKNASCILGLG